MGQLIAIVLKTLAIISLTGLLGIWNLLFKSRKERRSAFKQLIYEWYGKFDNCKGEELWGLYQTSLPFIDEGCVKIRINVPWWNRGRFDEARKRYQKIPRGEIEPSGIKAFLEDEGSFSDLAPHFEAGRFRLKNALDELRRCVGLF